MVGAASWNEPWLVDAIPSWLGDVVADALPHNAPQAPIPHTDLVDPPATVQPARSVPVAMLAQWMGAERMQGVLQRLIQRHAWGQAGEPEFWAALAGTDAKLAEALQAQLALPGSVQLRVGLDCPPDGPARARLSQSRHMALGAEPTQMPASTAQPALPALPALPVLPVLLRTPAGLQPWLLDTPEASVALPDAGCPAWLQPNAGGLGVYRSRLTPAAQAALLATPHLSPAELARLADDIRGLHAAGALGSAELLETMHTLARTPRADAAMAAVGLLHFLQPLAEVSAAGAYARHWQQAFGTRARALGWLPRPEDTAQDRRERARLVPALAAWGDDAALRDLARVLVQGWQNGRHGLPAETREALLATAARQGDDKLFDHLMQRVTSLATEVPPGRSAGPSARHSASPDPAMWWRVLGQFHQPALAERARERLLDTATDLPLALPALLGAQASDAGQRLAVLAFVSQYQRALSRRLGDRAAQAFSALFALFQASACSPAEAAQLRRLASAGAVDALSHKQMALALAAARHCAAWRAHHGALPAAPQQ
jgi:hypothetical protein